MPDDWMTDAHKAAEMVAWLREQVEATLLLPWHLPECQIYKPVPPNWPALFGNGFSCNCDLTAERLSAYEAHTAILDAVQRGLDGHPGGCVNVIGDDPAHYTPHDSCALHLEWAKTTLPLYAAQFVALAYKHRDGFREEWRPDAQ